MGTWNKSNLYYLGAVVILCVVVIRVFVFEAFFVKGDSMAPSIQSGDYVLVNKLSYIWSKPKRSDVVVVLPRVYPKKIVKRIIGLPGERFSIENERIIIRNERTDAGVAIDEAYLAYPNTPAIGRTETNIDPNEYFVLGDNRNESIDSRELGMINEWDISGRVFGVIRFKSLKYIGF